MSIKQCAKCSKDYEYNPNQRYAVCHPCHLERCRELRQQKKPELAENAKLESEDKRKCRTCVTVKNKCDFRQNRRICKDCERVDGREYRKSAIGAHNAKTWIDNNKDLYKSLQAEWYQKNKTMINEKYNERMKTDIEFRFIRTCRDRLRGVIKKEQTTCEYLGCDKELLVKWLTFNFNTYMNIQNHGIYWHIDHVIPLAYNNIAPFEFERLHWTNLSPYIATLNLSKHNNIDKEQIKTHLDALKKFIIIENISLEQKYIDLFAKHLDAGTPLEL